jgi:hypothetical protein
MVTNQATNDGSDTTSTTMDYIPATEPIIGTIASSSTSMIAGRLETGASSSLSMTTPSRSMILPKKVADDLYSAHNFDIDLDI